MKVKLSSLFFIFFCLLAFVSCKDGPDQIPFESKMTLFASDSISLPLDNKTSYEFQNIRYFLSDSSEWLINLNKNINGFNIYNLETGDLVSQFAIPKNGKQAIPDIGGFTFVNPDSIFVYSRLSLNQILLVNYQGEIKSVIKPTETVIDNVNQSLPILNHQSNTFSPTIFWNNKLYFTNWALFDFTRGENINNNYPLEVLIDLKSRKTQPMKVSFPKWMQNKGWNSAYLLHSKAFNGQSFVYSFQGDDSITVLNSGSEKRYYAGLSDLGNQKESVNSNSDRLKAIEEVMTTNIYWGIVYDPYREVYYRISDNPVRYQERHRTLLATYEKPISIIILDKEFQKIGEVDLVENKYLFYGLFVGQKGLYIPRINLEYEFFSEDLLTYSIYKLTEYQ